jgi:hypothetical protein
VSDDARRVVLDASNSRLYRPCAGAAKHARIRWQAAEYRLRWGRQWFDGPHVEVLDAAGPYGAGLQAFFATHAPLPDRLDHYVKVSPVRAMQAHAALTLLTWSGTRLEMRAEVPAGAYIVQDAGGEQYAMPAGGLTVAGAAHRGPAGFRS